MKDPVEYNDAKEVLHDVIEAYDKEMTLFGAKVFTGDSFNSNMSEMKNNQCDPVKLFDEDGQNEGEVQCNNSDAESQLYTEASFEQDTAS